MLNLGLCLAVELLHAPLPDQVFADVKRDKGAAQMAQDVCSWLVLGELSPTIRERVAFRLRMPGGKVALVYLLRLLFSPTEEDWQLGDKISGNNLLGAILRPFRLARKYGPGGQS